MSSTPLSAGKTWRIYLRLRATRLKNMILSAYGKKKKPAKGRMAVAGKSAAGTFSFLIFLYLSGVIGFSSVNATKSMMKSYGFFFTTVYATTLGFQWLVFTIMNMVTRELSRTDSDIEWLGTLPAPWAVLFTSKVVERGLLTMFMGILTVSLAASASFSGHSWPVIVPLALAFVIPLQIVAGIWQVSCEYFLRLKLSAAKLRNVQATLAFVMMVPLIMTLSPQLFNGGNVWFTLAQKLPRAAFDFAPLLAARIVTESGAATFANIALFWAQIVAGALLGVWALQKVLRAGAVGASSQDSTRGKSKTVAKRERAGFNFLTPIVRREFTLLARDRNFLAQTVLMPLLMLVVQVYAQLHISDARVTDDSSTTITPFVLFFSLSFLLATSCFQIINSEGQSLWILVSAPVSLESVFREKLKLWQRYALLVALAAITSFHAMGILHFDHKTIVRHILTIIGIFIYSQIAMSLAIFNSNPLSDDVQKRIKISAMYFYMGLVTLYFYGLSVHSNWASFVVTFLMSVFSFAIWQEAKAYIPFMLDPITAPKSKVSLMHGIFAAMLFFILQGLIQLLTLGRLLSPGAQLLLDFAGAGLLTFAIMRAYFWKKRTENLPRFVGRSWPLSLGLGFALGLLGFGIAWIYQKQMLAHHWFGVEAEDFIRPSFNEVYVFLGLLAVVAAPFAEEFIFRGLIFQGLKRNFPMLWAAVGSALIFGCVHPAASFVPVALMGLASALVYEKTKNLTASITLHAVYNACVIFAPLSIPHLYS